MNVLFCASEAAPFAASGGLGDVVAACPAPSATARWRAVVMPLYGDMKQEYLRKTNLYHKFTVPRLAQPVLRLV